MYTLGNYFSYFEIKVLTWSGLSRGAYTERGNWEFAKDSTVKNKVNYMYIIYQLKPSQNA